MRVTPEYIAGFLDGEGSFCINTGNRKAKRGGKKYPYYKVCVQVTSTQREIMDILQARYGGSYSAAKDQRPQNKPSWHWTVAHQQARKVVEEVLPHLILKKAQAQVLMEYFSTILHRSPGKPLPSDIQRRRDELWGNLRRLNRVGRDVGAEDHNVGN